ncbi:hypothetical protein O5254_27790, partial [Escherichia coli]|nr:hypothetical protein [Escherichia coli]
IWLGWSLGGVLVQNQSQRCRHQKCQIQRGGALALTGAVSASHNSDRIVAVMLPASGWLADKVGVLYGKRKRAVSSC